MLRRSTRIARPVDEAVRRDLVQGVRRGEELEQAALARRDHPAEAREPLAERPLPVEDADVVEGGVPARLDTLHHRERTLSDDHASP